MIHPHVVVTVLIAAAVFGCGTPLKPRFYTLRSVADPVPEVVAAETMSVVVASVAVPDVVDRPQIVLRAATNRVVLIEEARWAEPLRSEISYVIADNLRQLLTGARVTAQAHDAIGDASYTVAVSVQRFDSVLGEWATIEAEWSVRGGGDDTVIRSGRSTVREPTRGNTYDDLAAAHARALAAVSRDIAAAILAAAPKSP